MDLDYGSVFQFIGLHLSKKYCCSYMKSGSQRLDFFSQRSQSIYKIDLKFKNILVYDNYFVRLLSSHLKFLVIHVLH